jgi:tetratricopeptide (TPR) repeat protein
MKKTIALIFLFASLQTVTAQDLFPQNGSNYIDSLHGALAKASKPIDRFSIIVKISEYGLILNGGAVDSASTVQLLQIARQLKNDSLLAISYNWIGSFIAFTKGDNTSALDYYFKALPFAEKVNDKRRISSLYFDIALVYFTLQNNEEAFKNIRKGGENLPDQSSAMYPFMLVQYQRNMAQYYLLVHQPDSALHYAQAATETSKAIKSNSFEFFAMILSGTSYVQKGDMDMAGVYFKKVNVTAPSIKNNSGRLVFYQNYISFLLASNNITEAHQQAQQLMNIGKENGNNNMKLAGAGFMRQVFDSLHNKDSAYYYLILQSDISAQIFSQNNNNKIQALVFNEQLRSIEDTAQKAEEAQQRKENIQYVLIALSILTLVILYLLLSRSFITNTELIEFFGVIALLIVFEFLNLLLHPFLEGITHHSPVLMLLALVCIAALLVPLHHKVEHWATKKLVEKNKQIRLAAAKKTIEQLEGDNT